MHEKLKWVAAFALGLAIGAALVLVGQRWNPWCGACAHPHRSMNTDRLLERFNRKLNLTDPQKDQIGKILNAAREKMQTLKNQTWPQFKEIRESSRREIRALLTPEQQNKFDSMCELHDKRMEVWNNK